MDDGRSWLLYGANGYTGELLAREAVRRGLRPVLAGRGAEQVGRLAAELGLEHRVFPLTEVGRIAAELEPHAAVLLAAGPFSTTSAPVVEAALQTGTAYLDVTGEVSVFEACFARSEEARAAGSVLLPGVGFDVVPSDCLAASVAQALPGAGRLELAFHGELASGAAPAAGGRVGISRGTLKTMAENLAAGGAVREGGRLRRVPAAWRSRDVPFRCGTRHAVSIPWGDLATAWRSTGIPDIIVYAGAPPRQVTWMRRLRPLLPLAGLGPVQRFLRWRIDRRAPGPGPEERAATRSHLWARVEHPDGRALEGTLITPEGYTLTAAAGIECLARVLAGAVEPGTWTPAQAFGAGFVTELEGCELELGAVTGAGPGSG